MKYAINNVQRTIFVLLLYATAVSGIGADILKMENRSLFFIAWDSLIIFLVMFSTYYTPKGYAAIMVVLFSAIFLNFLNCRIPLMASVNGVREILMFIIIPVFYYKVFAEGNEEETAKYVAIMKKFAWLFLLMQVSASAWQFSQYGASDMVGGTYGNYNGGTQTLVIICLVFFLFQFQMPLWKKVILMGLLAPVLLNETKISFILIPMLGAFIFFEPKLKNILLAGIGGALFLFIISQFYVHEQANVGPSIKDIFNKDFLNDYLLAYDEEHADVPRFTRIILGYNIISQKTFTLLFGVEYGMFRGTTAGDVSAFAQNYNWLLSGTRPYLFFVMLQGGLVMLGGIFLVVMRICNFFRNVNKQTVFYFGIFLIIMLYVDSFRWHNFLVVFMFLLFFVNSEYFKSKAYLNEDTDSNY